LDMAAIVHEVEKRLAPQAAERHATLHAMDQWPLVSGVGAWVEIVWINYVTNALKYGSDNAEGLLPRVEMGWDCIPQATAERRYVRFWVKDNGRGLTTEQRARLFTPFTRLHFDEKEGHGLGLTIVERIISRLDGNVGAESTIGEGSLFWFTLPEFHPTAKQED
jgi:two-component system sensor histidine kinase/response regulator